MSLSDFMTRLTVHNLSKPFFTNQLHYLKTKSGSQECSIDKIILMNKPFKSNNDKMTKKRGWEKNLQPLFFITLTAILQ